MSYLRHAPGRGQTPQDRAIPGRTEEMVENRAGGYVFPVTPMTQFRRWLILGSEGGTYYASEREATLENVAVLDKVDPFEAILDLGNISVAGRAPKQDQILYALAYFTQHPDVEVRREVYALIPAVCRTATHLFQFVSYLDDQRRPDSHWGRGLRRAVGLWYAQDVNKVAYQVVKYRQRHGYTHKDLLRLAHPGVVVSSGNPQLPVTTQHARLYDWVCGRLVRGKDLPDIVRGYRRAQRKKNKAKLPELIQQHGLPWECIEDEDLNRPEVLDALAGGRSGDKHAMPMGALIRQLPRLTRAGLLKPMGDRTQDIVGMLGDSTFLRQARIHPIQLLVAQMTYRSGQSLRGNSTWVPVPEIVEALSDAFYLAFRSVEPTGLRHLLAVDVSGSMTGGSVMGVPGFSPRMGAAAMALVQANVGDPYHMVAFSADPAMYRRVVEEQERHHRQLYGVSVSRSGWGYGSTESYFQDPESWAIRPLDISPRQRIDGAMETMRTTQAGGTDAALPMLYAKDNELEADVFVIYTDNESWAGKVHVTQALKAYRKASGINARLVVCAMTATSYSVADPADAGQMDVVGFDAATPEIISSFARGDI